MVVFWSSDPEATGGVYGAFEGTIRRQWLKELGIQLVHIDPFYNHTAALLGGKWLAPRPATGNSLALAIAYVGRWDLRSGRSIFWVMRTAYPKLRSGRKRKPVFLQRMCVPWQDSGAPGKLISPPVG